MIYHQFQIIPVTAGADLSAAEGCFIKLSSRKAVVTTASDAANIFGIVHSAAPQDAAVSIILPGHSGIVGMLLHSTATGVETGTKLALAANGTVKPAGGSDTAVAVALATGTPGELVPARFI